MKKSGCVLFVLMVLMVAMSPTYGCAEEIIIETDVVAAEENKPFFKNVFANVDIASQFANWTINGDNDRSVMQYKTEGLAMMKISGNLGIGSKSFVTVSYERPFDDNAHQQEMLAANVSSSSGLEKFVGGVKLDPIADLLFKENSLLHNLARKALSVRFKYTNEVYFSEATTRSKALYLPSNATFNHQTRTVSGGRELAAGEKLGAKTTLTEEEISVPLVTFDMPYYLNGELWKMAKHDLRIGHYSRKWSRPSDTDALTIKDRSGVARPVVYNADYKSDGVMLSVETTDVDAPGFNADFSFRIGYDDKISSVIDWSKLADKPVDTGFYALNLSLWYNYYFNRTRYQGWCMSLGGSWTQSAMNVEIPTKQADSSTQTIVHDTDLFTKYFMTLSYRF